MPGDDLTTANIPFNPIHPEISDKPSSVKAAPSPMDTVINAFKEMKETAVEGTRQFKGLFKSTPNVSDLKVGQAVSSFFSKTIPEFGKKILDQAIALKDRVDNFVNKDKRYEAEHNKYLPAWAAGGEEKLSVSDKLSQAAKPLTRRMSQLSEAASPVLKALSEKVDSLRSSIPDPLEMFKSNIETGDDLAMTTLPETQHRDVEGMKKSFYESLSQAKDFLPFKQEGYKDGMENSLLKMKQSIGFKEDPNRKITYNFAEASKEPIRHNGFSVTIVSDKMYHFGPEGKANIKGERLLQLQGQSRVTYDSSVVKDPSKLAKLIQSGPQKISDRAIAAGRCVVSTDILHTTFDNKSIDIDEQNVDRYLFQSYTVNAPNLNDPDIKKAFLGADGKIDMQKWKQEMTRVFTHFLTEAKRDDIEMLVLPAMGMGAFMPANLQQQAGPLFLEALKEAKQASGAQMDIVITGISLPNEEGIRFEAGKDSIAVLQTGLEAGLKSAVVNAGDSSCQTGQHAVEKDTKYVVHIAQEEHKAILDTSIITQNANANPRMANAKNYRPYK